MLTLFSFCWVWWRTGFPLIPQSSCLTPSSTCYWPSTCTTQVRTSFSLQAFWLVIAGKSIITSNITMLCYSIIMLMLAAFHYRFFQVLLMLLMLVHCHGTVGKLTQHRFLHLCLVPSLAELQNSFEELLLFDYKYSFALCVCVCVFVSSSTERQCDYAGTEEEKCQDPVRESSAAPKQRR